MWNFSFNTIDLAILQENYEAIYKQGGTITSEQLSNLKKHVWVILASKLAPSNLVIRHWCLIDLFSNSPDHADKIKEMIDLLSYKKDDNGMRIWAEGGYYFWYTMCILQLWLDKFFSWGASLPLLPIMSKICQMIEEICKGIAETAYFRNGEWYVAPFGDVRKSPMSNMPIGIDLQNIKQQSNAVISVISRSSQNSNIVVYKLRARPIRFNLHIPKNNAKVTVINDTVIGFKFYTGWSSKYKNQWDELWDMLSFKRLISFWV
jgi:hypothetical protein